VAERLPGSVRGVELATDALCIECDVIGPFLYTQPK